MANHGIRLIALSLLALAGGVALGLGSIAQAMGGGGMRSAPAESGGFWAVWMGTATMAIGGIGVLKEWMNPPRDNA